uniref:Uncharacterized protein n=1 Tax=Anopheles farauti TaxID=69004 RepID=A0A182Q7P4_9DIPT
MHTSPSKVMPFQVIQIFLEECDEPPLRRWSTIWSNVNAMGRGVFVNAPGVLAALVTISPNISIRRGTERARIANRMGGMRHAYEATAGGAAMFTNTFLRPNAASDLTESSIITAGLHITIDG